MIRQDERPRTPQVRVRAAVRGIATPNKKIILMQPVIEGLERNVRFIQTKVTNAMKLELQDDVNILIHDDKGYKKAVAKRGYHPEEEIALHLRDENQILVNGSRAFSDDIQFDANIDFLQTDLTLGIGVILVHELAHAIHFSHDPQLFMKADKLHEITRNKMSRAAIEIFSSPYELVVKARIDKAVFEGIAVYTTESVLADIDGKKVETIKLSLNERIRIFLNANRAQGSYDLGAWFVGRVERLMGKNPIKIIIENPPKNLVELLVPERYVARVE